MYVCTANVIDKGVGIHYAQTDCGSLLRESHYHDGFGEVMIIRNGTVINHTKQGEDRLESGDIVFLPVGSAHTLSEPSDDLILYNFAVLPPVLHEALAYLAVDGGGLATQKGWLNAKMLDFLDENHAQVLEIIREQERACLLRAALALLVARLSKAQPEVDGWFDGLVAEMQRPHNFQKGVARMQQLAYCSASHLSRVCMKELGVTPTRFVDGLRVQYACNLLRHSKFRIVEISMECGYTNLSYFYRRFSQWAGMTPRQYRSLHMVAYTKAPPAADESQL